MKEHIKATMASSLLILILVGLDQWSKWAIQTHMKLYESIPIMPGFFKLFYVQNTGAGFSLFEGFGPWFFLILTLIALCAIVYYFYHTNDRMVQLSLTLIFAGAIGNLIDRMRLGYVVDFFSFNLFGWDFPVFNIADICISVGFILLVVYLLWDEYRKEKQWKNNIKS